MVTIRQRNDPVRIFWRRVAMLVLFVVVILGLWVVFDVYMKERESSKLRREAELHRSELTTRELKLSASIGSLETERGKEQALRDAYEVGKEGEGMVLIVDQTPSTTVPTYIPKQTWFQRFFWW